MLSSGAPYNKPLALTVAGIPPIGSRQIVQVRLAVRPVAHRGDDIALNAARTLRLRCRYFTGGDAIGPIRQIVNRNPGKGPLHDVDHLAARLTGLQASQPRVLLGCAGRP